MRHALITIALLAVAGIGVAGIGATAIARPAADERGTFRSRVDAVSLAVTVTSPGNRLVRDLQESDFVVYEDGVPQQLVYFSSERSPVALSLLLDTSASMTPRLGLAQQAASQFSHDMNSDDLVQVINFDSHV